MSPSELQATLVDFALKELVRSHRTSFQPLWSAESWAKLLIWLALNCGCATDPASLETFALALGPSLSQRLRHCFFSRELEDLGLQLLADPADAQVLVQALQPHASGAPDLGSVRQALRRVELEGLVIEEADGWQAHEALVAIPRRDRQDDGPTTGAAPH